MLLCSHFVVQARQGILLHLFHHVQLMPLLLINILAVYQHPHRVIFLPAEDMGSNAHPVIRLSVCSDHEIILQIVSSVLKGFQHFIRMEGTDISLPVFLFDLLLGNDAQGLVKGYVRRCPQTSKICGSSFAGCLVMGQAPQTYVRWKCIR